MRRALSILALLALLALIGLALTLFVQIDQFSTRLLIAILVVLFLLGFIAALQHHHRS